MSQEKISILFLAANPVDTTQLGLNEECNLIDDEIQKGRYRDTFELKQRLALTVNDIQNVLLKAHPSIVHFSGHGNESGSLVFQNNDGTGDEVSPGALTELFRAINHDNKIRCVVLNACYSEKQARAIAKHVDCVIGMKRAVSDEAATRFAGSFYNALAHGKSVKTAFDLACVQLGLQDIPEEKTPKLMVRQDVDPSSITFRAEVDARNTSPASKAKLGIAVGVAAAAVIVIVLISPTLFVAPGQSASPEQSSITPPTLITTIEGPQNDVQLNIENRFVASTTGGVPPYNYTWDFDDGDLTVITNSFVEHAYSTLGPKTVILTVRDSAGGSAQDSLFLNVLATQKNMDVGIANVIRDDNPGEDMARVIITNTPPASIPVRIDYSVDDKNTWGYWNNTTTEVDGWTSIDITERNFFCTLSSYPGEYHVRVVFEGNGEFEKDENVYGPSVVVQERPSYCHLEPVIVDRSSPALPEP